jgi:sec-independent protein translocase protein TatA
MFEGLFQPMHLLVIFGIALLVFGPKKLPELGKGIGEGIRGFKSAMKADEEKPATTTTAIANDATRGIKSQLAAQLDGAPQESPTDCSHESVVNE